MTRPFAGASKLHYTFDPSKLSMDFINAVGSTPTLSYHKSKTVSTIGLFPANKAPACVCSEPAVPFGQLKKNPPMPYLTHRYLLKIPRTLDGGATRTLDGSATWTLDWSATWTLDGSATWMLDWSATWTLDGDATCLPVAGSAVSSRSILSRAGTWLACNFPAIGADVWVHSI